MSLEPTEMKSSKRMTQMGSGTHLAIIADMYYLCNAAKEHIKPEGHSVMVVLFKNDKSQIHEQHYTIDGQWRSELFKKMLQVAKVEPSEDGKTYKKNVIGKRIWLSIKATHHINDGNPIMDEDGPKIEYFVFKIHPYIDGGKRPTLAGDPLLNNGLASGDFLDYKNFSLEPPAKKVVVEPAKPIQQTYVQPAPQVQADDINWDEQPRF